MADETTEKLPFQQSIVISEELGHPPLDVISAVAPPGGAQRYCTEQTEQSSVPVHPESSVMDEKLRWIEQQVQYLLNKADKLQAHLINGCDRLQKESLTQAVRIFLRTCQPWFAYLEATARSCLPQRPPLPPYIRTQLLQFSQQLCTQLEQLVLMYASLNLLSVEETEPSSVSHFYIGQCQLNTVSVSIFRYCRPALFRVRPGAGGNLYKRMRWNVERPREWPEETEGQQGKNTGIGKGDSEDTEFYFLCYEDVAQTQPEMHSKRGKRQEKGPEAGHSVRRWSIGQWVQTDPDPVNADLFDWLLCPTPQGQYKLLLHLGTEEPSACTATDYLLGVLISMEGPGECSAASGHPAHT
ncbi:UPF0575 protein C19orf67 homolog isoform X2 [Paramormyrops kingsleyae]|uniref:Si:ch211-214c7.5 n=1 Tax=Paramormyrops kingsleyae TaxID=1676925 RepID=A0A3B3S262_9TELE|nr:UPF0575 protein C19orf67 homolog isoform X1 [Paramormyrops kingsleyae]XP_023647643.1 UPF0575 protein C19orf67 homolog isoform X1 [Paramormyrops kingsleyae]XP_023647644.1 UPF0575 protein C19orf67 homolog isoform X1 [Paramormyrops kingsleyae]XP_023647646.1 UPF0575 protein C19orf67 homolog isoform X1 [Paramormyrops kingsleyae]